MQIENIITDDILIAFLNEQYKQTGNHNFLAAAHTIELYRRSHEIMSWELSNYVWISVDDELPKIATTEKGWGDHKVSKSVRVLCACKQKSGKVLIKEGYYELWDYSTSPSWKIPGSIDSVTHWMPLPEPPTEKEN